MINIIISAIETLAENKTISVFDYDDAKNVNQRKIKEKGFIGYYSNKENLNYIDSHLLYNALKEHYEKKNEVLACTKADMNRELFENGFLYHTKSQERPGIRREDPIEGKEKTFIALFPDKIKIPYYYIEKEVRIITK